MSVLEGWSAWMLELLIRVMIGWCQSDSELGAINKVIEASSDLEAAKPMVSWNTWWCGPWLWKSQEKRIVLMGPRQKVVDGWTCLVKWGSRECLPRIGRILGLPLDSCWNPPDRGEECCRMLLLTLTRLIWGSCEVATVCGSLRRDLSFPTRDWIKVAAMRAPNPDH